MQAVLSETQGMSVMSDESSHIRLGEQILSLTVVRDPAVIVLLIDIGGKKSCYQMSLTALSQQRSHLADLPPNAQSFIHTDRVRFTYIPVLLHAANSKPASVGFLNGTFFPRICKSVTIPF